MSSLARPVPAPPSTRRGGLLGIGPAAAATLPGVVLALTGAHPSAPLQAVVYGVAIIGAAFLLSWAAEAAQVDISAGLAIAVLALIAVLPEYAVDFVFTFRGGADYARHGVACAAPGATGETNCGLALANMTGANRILVGIGWSMVVLLAAWRIRARSRARTAVDAQDALVLVGLSVLYLVLAVVLFVRQRHQLGRLLRDGFRTPYSVLSADPP